MESYLADSGYILSQLSFDEKVIKGIRKIRILSRREIPFLIIYVSDASIEVDISNLYGMLQEENDEFCSLFLQWHSEGKQCFSKNMRTGQYNKLRNLISYRQSQKASLSSAAIESDSFENVFFTAHSFLRDLDGLHPDEALDELCKLIYAKLYEEENFLNVFNMPYGNAEEYAANIRELYKTASEYDMRVYALKIPGYKRSRGVFTEPIYLSANAIQKAGQLFSKYCFSKTDIDYKARAFQNVYRPATRSGMGQYFTPIQVIKLIVRCLSPKSSDLVIDPFSGSGHFLTETLIYVENVTMQKKAISEFIFYKLHGIEKSERMVRISMTDMRLHGDGHSNIRCTDALLPFETYGDLEPCSFDIVMTNPPFGSVLQKESYSYLGNFQLLNGKGKVPLEVLGLERSIQLLRTGGKIGIVLPESIFVNKSYKYVRDWLLENVKVRGIISLPQHTFSPFGANIKTSILIATKCKKCKDYNVFTGIVENIGFDAKGDEIVDADWPAIAQQFTEFIEEEGW